MIGGRDFEWLRVALAGSGSGDNCAGGMGSIGRIRIIIDDTRRLSFSRGAHVVRGRWRRVRGKRELLL